MSYRCTTCTACTACTACTPHTHISSLQKTSPSIATTSTSHRIAPCSIIAQRGLVIDTDTAAARHPFPTALLSVPRGVSATISLSLPRRTVLHKTRQHSHTYQYMVHLSPNTLASRNVSDPWSIFVQPFGCPSAAQTKPQFLPHCLRSTERTPTGKS